MKPLSLSILIPCYNEQDTIAGVVAAAQRADAAGLSREIVVVDDGSTDGTFAALSALEGIKVLRHPKNRGKGAAVRTALAAAAGDVVLIQDADLEYDAKDYRAVLMPLVEGRAELVLGSRFAYERPHFFFHKRRSPFFSHYVGNLTIVALTNYLYGADVTDYEGAYKAFRRETALELDLRSEGFELDNELVCKLMRRGAAVVEVPIAYAPRGYEQGKKIVWRDGVRMLWAIVKWRFMPL